MRKFIAAAFLLSTGLATPALAQDGWDEERPEFGGFYVGGSIGATLESSDDSETILFDRDLDGDFDDTVTLSGGGNAFQPGFCAGTVGGPSLPTDGCDSEGTALEFAARVGFDWQSGPLVIGAVAEIGTSDMSSSVTAFSTTPASYTFTREVDMVADLRARLGFTVTPTTLVYGTAGGSYAKLDNSFTTTNTVNAVVENLDEESFGLVLGGGVEQKLGRNVSVGVEYLYRQHDDESTVRLASQTGTPATNPFILGNPNGTDFARSSDSFAMHSVRAVVNFRF